MFGHSSGQNCWKTIIVGWVRPLLLSACSNIIWIWGFCCGWFCFFFLNVECKHWTSCLLQPWPAAWWSENLAMLQTFYRTCSTWHFPFLSPTDLIQATNETNVNIPQMADTLFERATNSSWVVVFKALVTTHHLMVHGNEVSVNSSLKATLALNTLRAKSVSSADASCLNQ